MAVDAPLRVGAHREDGQISIDVIISADVNAPPPVEMQRTDRKILSTDSPPLERQSICDELRDRKTYIDCLVICFYFLFCHAITSVLLSITICCRCCTSMIKMPDCIEERTGRTRKVVAFLAKNLSALGVSSLLILFAQWVLFRPIDVKPHLGASTVHEFELLQPVGDTPPHLRFNVTTYVLLHSGHDFYKIRYCHFAGSVLYADVKLGPADDDELPPFTQKPHESALKRLQFTGRLQNASGTVEETFARERQLRTMLVRIRVTLNYGFWPFKGDYFTIYDCPLHSPFPQMGEPAVSSPAWCNTVHV